MSVRVVAHLKARGDRIEEAREILKGLIEPTRSEPGCILYELLQNDADPTDLTFVEEWSSDAALTTHLESGHIRELRARAEELFAAPPDIRRYTFIA